MAKRTRSGEGSGLAKCDLYLTSCAFEEEAWSPCVAWVVGRCTEDFKHIEALNTIVQTGLRKLFTVITKEQLCIDVRELGDPKNKKAKEIPPYSEICEACKTYLDIGEPVPTPLMAKLIKWKMLLVKDADLRRQAAENKSASEKKKGKEKDTVKERVKSPKKSDKKGTEGQQPKEGSKMKKRGEDDEEHKYIDDEPEDGAQHYFIITGFHDPYLFQFLEAVNVNVSCIISVTSQELFKHEGEAPVVDEKTESLRQELNVFWTDVLPLLQNQPDSSTLHDIARLDYEVSYMAVPTDPQDTEQRVNYSSGIFDDIALMLYNLIDSKRLYYTYLANLKLINVPSTAHSRHSDPSKLAETQESEKNLLQNVDMRYYNDLMNTIPNESVSVALIMHCMLEQVVATEKGIDPPSELAAPAKSNGINTELSAYLGEMTAKLGLTSQELELLAEDFHIQPATKEKNEGPKIFYFNDEIFFRTHHLKPNYGFNPEEVERKMLKLLPISKYCQLSNPSSAEERKNACKFHELFHLCALQGLSKQEVDHALRQFVFECMELTKCDRNGFPLEILKEGLPQQYIPWDDPLPYFKFVMPESEKNIPEELPSVGGNLWDRDERDEEMATFPHQGFSTSSFGDKPRPRRLSEAQRISDVIMELVVTLDRDACSATEKLVNRIEITKASQSSELKKGIIVHTQGSMAGSVHSRYSASNSVRFDVPSPPKQLEDMCQDVIGLKEIEQSLLEITETQQRILDNWCFLEHYKPDVFLQVLQEAIYHHPYIEVYQANRDSAIMLALHNPHNKERQFNSNWQSELHSNTGFRNYLEHTAESIQTWLKMKELEYKAAQQMAKEATNLQKDEEEKQKQMEKADKKAKKSPPRSGKSKSPGLSASSSFDGHSTTFINPYIRQGSIKAIQQEQMRLVAEEEEREKNKSARKSRSAQKLKEKQDKEKETPEKRRKSIGKVNKSKRNSDDSSERFSTLQTDVNMETQSQAEKSPLPFLGYDTGNHFIHMLGANSTLYPSDGGTIQTERTEIVQGSIAVKSVVKKDGHIFVVHIVNPREDMNLPEEYAAELDAINGGIDESFRTSNLSDKEMSRDEGLNMGVPASSTDFLTNEQFYDFKKASDARGRSKGYAVSQFGSVTAHLSDGMILAMSQFGPTGESYLQPYQPPAYIQPVEVEMQLQTTIASPTRTKSKGIAVPEPEKEKPKYNEDTPPEENEIPKPDTPPAQQEFQELHVTCPDGLSVKYVLQCSAGVSTDYSDSQYLMVRQSYPFKNRGVQSCESVRNKYIESEISRVITADGNVIKNMVDGSVEVLGSDGTVSIFTGSWNNGKSSSKQRGKKSKRQSGTSRSTKNPNASWTITYPNGERLQILKATGDIVELSSLPVCVACDPETKQVMCSRDDHVIIITYPDGSTVVEHADGTRISTYYKDITLLDEAETPTPRNYVQTMKFIKVECPAFATVEFNTATSENLTVFGNGTTINVFPDGYYMFHHSKGGRIEIDTEGTMTYFPQRRRFLEHLNSDFDLQYIIRHNDNTIVETMDPNGNIFHVRSTGESFVTPAISEDLFGSASITKQEKEGQQVNHAPRFFVIHDDCSATELLRYEDVIEYLLLADQNPAAAVLTEEIPHHPGVYNIAILKPYLSGVSERWFKKYDQDCILPQGLRCRDLKTIQPKEYKKPGPVFGTNVGKGLSIGTNVKVPAKIPILKCPEKLELRQLLQFPPVTKEMREKMTHALHDFAAGILARQQAENLMSVEDPRSQEERLSALELNMFAYSLRRAATKFESEDMKTIYEQAVAPPPPCPPSKPKPKQSKPSSEQGRMDKADEEARVILKKKIFEPYFESELGKVFVDKLARQSDDTHNKSVNLETVATNRDAVYDSKKGVRSKSLGANISSLNAPDRHQNTAALSFSAQILANLKNSTSQNLSVHNVDAVGAAAEKRLSYGKSSVPQGEADHLAKENQSLGTDSARTSGRAVGEIQQSQSQDTGPMSGKPGSADHLEKENESLGTDSAMTSHRATEEMQQSQSQDAGPQSGKPGSADHLEKENESLGTDSAMTSRRTTEEMQQSQSQDAGPQSGKPELAGHLAKENESLGTDSAIGEIQQSQPHHIGTLSGKLGLADHLAKEKESLGIHSAMTRGRAVGEIQQSQPHHTGPLSGRPGLAGQQAKENHSLGTHSAMARGRALGKIQQSQPHQTGPLSGKPAAWKKNKRPSSKSILQVPGTMFSKEDSHRSSFITSMNTDIYGSPRTEADIIDMQGRISRLHSNLKISEMKEPEPEETKIKTSAISLARPSIKRIKNMSKMKGLVAYPDRVEFGTLIEGYVYSYVLSLINTGFNTCRFKITRPQPSSGLNVKYTGGSVAAGLSADVVLELCAIPTKKDAKGFGTYSQILHIVTENEVLEVPIVADVVSHEYYNNPVYKEEITRVPSVRLLGKKKTQQANKDTESLTAKVSKASA